MLNFERLGPLGTAKPGDFAAAADPKQPNYGARCLVLREHDSEFFEVEILGTWIDPQTGLREPPQVALGYRGALAPFLPPEDDTELHQDMVKMWEGAV